MRKHRAPLAWPRRDPRRYRFAVPNEVWEYKLRPTEFLILSYLCYRQAHGRESTVVGTEAVADSLRLTVATVEKHLAALTDKGLVMENGALASKREAGKFFTLPNEVFLLALPPSAFLVYAYLLYCEDRRTHQCHPSCRTIAGTTGLSLNTVVRAVGILADKGLLAVARSRWFNEAGLKRNGNNIYTILPTRTAAEDYHQRQLRQAEADTARWEAQKLAVEGKAGERLGVAGAPSRPRPPAVRAVQGQGEGVPTPREMGKVGSWAAQSPKPQEKQGRSALKSRR